MVTVGLINSLIRIFGDPYLRWKLHQILCKRKNRSLDKSFDITSTDALEESGVNDSLMRKSTFTKDEKSKRNHIDMSEEDILSQIDRYREIRHASAMNRFSSPNTLFDGESKIPLTT